MVVDQARIDSNSHKWLVSKRNSRDELPCAQRGHLKGCGRHYIRVADGGKKIVSCRHASHLPRDKSTLLAQGDSIPTIYRCENCHGLWFPMSAVAAVIGQPPQLPAVPIQAAGSQGALVCPEDGKPLVRFLVDGVELDICPSCKGVWFDRGEIEYIRAKKAGTIPIVEESGSNIAHTLAGAAGDAAEKLGGIQVDPNLIVLTAEVGPRAVGAVPSNPAVMEAMSAAVGGAVDLAGAMPDALGSAAEVAPDIVGAIVGAILELIAGALTN